MSGNFFATSRGLRYEDGHLVGELQTVGGEWVEARLNLNEKIGNHNGRFEWGWENFAGSAENIELSIEGDGPVAVLRAQLRNENGDLQDADLNLSERIRNNDGNFYWTE